MDSEYIICAQCKKRVAVLHKDIWAYKKRLAGKTMRYFCSWKCLREDEKKGTVNMARKLTLEQKKKAVQISIDGGDPIEFLRECGCDAPDKTWWYIKSKLKDSNPELYAQIPDGRKRNAKEHKKAARMEKPVPKTEEKILKSETEHVMVPGIPVKKKEQEKQKEINDPKIQVLLLRCGDYVFENMDDEIRIVRDGEGEKIGVRKDAIEILSKAMLMAKKIFLK